MITQLTNNKILLSEFYADIDKALYWHGKKHCTNNKYEHLRDQMTSDAISTSEEQIGEIIDYSSGNKNKWKVFDVCEVKDGFTRFSTRSFLYWDTIGSVGAVMPSIDENGKRGVIIFTSHFFYRLAQRRNSVADVFLVCAFMTRNSSVTMRPGKDEQGRDCIDIFVREGICKGYIREAEKDAEGNVTDAQIIEARTFYCDEWYTKKEQKKIEKLRKSKGEDGVLYKDMLAHTVKSDTIRSSSERFARLSGYPRGFGAFTADFYEIFFSIGLNDEQKKVYGKDRKESVFDLIGDENLDKLHKRLLEIFFKHHVSLEDLYNMCELYIPDFNKKQTLRNIAMWCGCRPDLSREVVYEEAEMFLKDAEDSVTLKDLIDYMESICVKEKEK